MYRGKGDRKLPTHAHVYHARVNRRPGLCVALLISVRSFAEKHIGVVSTNGVAHHANPNQVNRLISFAIKHNSIVGAFVLGSVSRFTYFKAAGDGAGGWVNQWVEWVASYLRCLIE